MHFSEEEIKRLISEKILGLTCKKISSPTEELIESGILSSITVAELAVELEKTFSVSISFMEINKEHFHDLASITNFVRSKM